MKLFAVLFAVLTLGFVYPSAAENLSARSVFDEVKDPPARTVEAKIDGMRQAMAERAHEKEMRAQNSEVWRTETEGSVAGAGIRMIQALALCVGVLLIGLHLFKKYNKNQGRLAGGRRMRVIERLPISAKTSVIMLEVEGRSIIVSVGPEHVSQIGAESGNAVTDEYSDPMEVLCREEFKATAA